MNFAFDTTQDQLRDNARRLLGERVDLTRLTGQGNRPDTRYAMSLWQELVNLGWPGLLVPERYGGSGLGFVDWVVIVEELGRSLAPCPYLGAFAGAQAILLAGSEEQRQQLLGGTVDGSVRLALAWNEHVDRECDDEPTLCVRDGGMDGTKHYVADADTATHFVVTARAASGELRLYVVANDSDRVRVDVLEWMDPTRRVAHVHFDGATAAPMPGAYATSWSALVDAMRTTLAAECAGGADAILQRTVAYAKERKQFGKTIASYQAIKHRCAELLTKVESSKALAYYASWALDAAPLERTVAAAMAKCHAADTFKTCTAEAVQIHGAIGFTWEMPVHLYYKRARANAVTFGTNQQLRDAVISNVVERAA